MTKKRNKKKDNATTSLSTAASADISVAPVVPDTSLPTQGEFQARETCTSPPQGECNWWVDDCSWAYHATSMVESALAIKNKRQPDRLAVKELLDCCPKQSQSSCGDQDPIDCCAKHSCGGSVLEALAYIKQNGLSLEREYESRQVSRKAMIKDFGERITNAETLKVAVVQGPVVVKVNDCRPLFSYRGGVFDVEHTFKVNKTLHPTEIRHAMLLVGYAEKYGKPVWIVQNSWGSDWGDEGYIYVKRGSNILGIEEGCVDVVA
ncbi:hypothetical protein IFM89_002579 [Coptis chinensis]|uniref:Peptidase C1A papain C-terminal domain-containing protein n=1 Tax=Coptis chinensis TaxID=261450 RepID=A0A835LI54_9MAGN|nr:hypothetical protein IFM89_002579 [Coptis chinensis]